MKTIEYYMKLPYKLEIFPDPDEGGYVASYPDPVLQFCHRNVQIKKKVTG